MVGNLNELNRLLISLRELSPNKQRVSVAMLTRHLKDRVFLGVNPIFEPIMDFAVQLGLTSSTTRGIALTPEGLEFLRENPDEFYELRPRQCALLVRKCYLDGAFRREMKEFVKKFEAESPEAPIAWSAVDSEPLGELEWIANHLLQLGVLVRQNDSLFVADLYRATIMQFGDEGGDFTEEQFERYLIEKRVLAGIAELFVVQFEQERLRSAQHAAEAACVKQISRIRVNAGYDVNSFNGRSVGLTHDRFIEVKGSGQAAVRFIWTPNEMEKAKQLGDKYWIYFVGDIDRRKGLVGRSPVLIQNPYARLQEGVVFKAEPQSMVVRANLAGTPLNPAIRIRT